MLCACKEKPIESITDNGIIGTYVTNGKDPFTMILKSNGKMELFVVDARNGKETLGGPSNNYQIDGKKIVVSIQGGGTSSSELKNGSFEYPGLGVFYKTK